MDYFKDLCEPCTEEAATSEQLTQLNDLQNQIKELEQILETTIGSSNDILRLIIYLLLKN